LFYFRLCETHNVSLKAGAKVQLLFNLASVFESFLENFISPFLLEKDAINRRLHLLNLSMNLLPLGVGKDNYFFYFSQIFFLKLSLYF